MTDDELRHLTKLGTVYADFVLSDDFDEVRHVDSREWRDARQCLRLMARAMIELARRQDMRPRFRIAARTVHR